MRTEERVTPLELFFDLFFVLALTQCTALMAATPTWEGIARGVLVLGVCGGRGSNYAWLTSVVDPEARAVRIAMFPRGALVAALSMPRRSTTTRSCSPPRTPSSALRIVLVLASAGDPSDDRCKGSQGTAVGVSLLTRPHTDGVLQGALWATALLLISRPTSSARAGSSLGSATGSS
jgi:hypothetical protein